MPTNQEDKAKELVKLYQRVLGDGDGKELVHDLCQRFYLLGDTFDPDPQVAAYKQGQRAVVLHILDTLEMSIVDLERIFSESARRRTLQWGEE